MSTIIAISNQKGGVSKTTTAYNLGACMALNHKKKMLLVDIDPQANLSEYLGYEFDGKPTMTQLIMTVCSGGVIPSADVISAIRHNETADVDYIPSDINLAGIESFMTTAISRETILRRILSDEITSSYDYVIIDCLPSLSTLLINALATADKVIIPVQTQKFSVDGLQALEALLFQVKTTINPEVNLLGILPTMTERTIVSRNTIDMLYKKYGDKLFKSYISKSVEAAKSTETGIPLCLTKGKLSSEYEALTQEILEREENMQ